MAQREDEVVRELDGDGRLGLAPASDGLASHHLKRGLAPFDGVGGPPRDDDELPGGRRVRTAEHRRRDKRLAALGMRGRRAPESPRHCACPSRRERRPRPSTARMPPAPSATRSAPHRRPPWLMTMSRPADARPPWTRPSRPAFSRSAAFPAVRLKTSRSWPPPRSRDPCPWPMRPRPINPTFMNASRESANHTQRRRSSPHRYQPGSWAVASNGE